MPRGHLSAWRPWDLGAVELLSATWVVTTSPLQISGTIKQHKFCIYWRNMGCFIYSHRLCTQAVQCYDQGLGLWFFFALKSWYQLDRPAGCSLAVTNCSPLKTKPSWCGSEGIPGIDSTTHLNSSCPSCDTASPPCLLPFFNIVWTMKYCFRPLCLQRNVISLSLLSPSLFTWWVLAIFTILQLFCLKALKIQIK